MKKVTLHVFGLVALACQLAYSATAHAQSSDALRDAAQRAISTNPEVTARFNALRAAIEEVDVARGSYLPRVDMSAEVGRTSDRITSNTPNNQSQVRTGIALSATQLLWDGLGTRNQVDRLDHARLTRYFEFLDASEQTALDAARAYIDVARARQLVKLSEDNYVQHRQVFEQIQARVKAGVGRGVDLEQAGARVALADSNLSTESANLHDITERYRRIVGAPPSAAAPLSRVLDNGLPKAPTVLIETAVRRNVSIAAAIENLRAAQAQSREREGLFHPRVEARARSGFGNNFDGVPNQKRDTSASLVMNWNLFNGGSDIARVRQATALLNQAADARDKSCRDARQTAAIAFNDVNRLIEQMGALERNTSASEKARDAYRQQFEIGQRSLLDVLNAENELYSAKRAMVSAEHDLLIAKARTHASMSGLVGALGLARAGNEEVPDAANWQAGEDVASRCPLGATELALTPRSELDARARAQIATSSTSPALSTQALASVLSSGAGGVNSTAKANAAGNAEASGVLVPLPSAMSSLPNAPARKDPPPSSPVSQRLIDWANAWTNKDVTSYLAFYDATFKPANVGRTKWFDNRKRLVTREGPIELHISNVQRRTLSPNLVETTFDQVYTSTNFKDQTQKVLQWKRKGNEWYIVKESNR
jgi:adhesin transport system outer membrane protein